MESVICSYKLRIFFHDYQLRKQPSIKELLRGRKEKGK